MKILTRLVAALAIALLLALLHTASATAAQYQGWIGQLGAVALNGPLLTVYDRQQPGLGGTYLTVKTWEASGFTVGSSPAYSGTQDVVVTYSLQRFINGQWTQWVKMDYGGRVTGAQTLRFPPWAYTIIPADTTRFPYRFVYGISWRVAGTTTILGTTGVGPNSTADHRCHIRFGTPCEVYWDGIVF